MEEYWCLKLIEEGNINDRISSIERRGNQANKLELLDPQLYVFGKLKSSTINGEKERRKEIIKERVERR